MADIDRIRADIAEIAQRPKAVTFAEIERIIDQLGRVGFPTKSRSAREAHLFRVKDVRFTVCKHNPGRKELKPCYVKEFLKAMTALGLFEKEPDTGDE